MASATPVQSTVDEWEGSLAARTGRGCATCHLPDGAHDFAGAHTPDRVRRALIVEVEPGDDAVRFVLRSRGVGHRLPTGDPFRRLEVQILAGEAVVASRVLGRIYAADPLRLVEDGWIPPDGAVQLTLDRPPEATAWRVRYAYGDPALEHLLAEADRGFVVHEGALAP